MIMTNVNLLSDRIHKVYIYASQRNPLIPDLCNSPLILRSAINPGGAADGGRKAGNGIDRRCCFNSAQTLFQLLRSFVKRLSSLTSRPMGVPNEEEKCASFNRRPLRPNSNDADASEQGIARFRETELLGCSSLVDWPTMSTSFHGSYLKSLLISLHYPSPSCRPWSAPAEAGAIEPL